MKYREVYRGGGIYRSNDGIIFGVCAGIAERFDLSVFWMRLLAVILVLMTGVWPIGALYIVAAVLLKPDPVLTI